MLNEQNKEHPNPRARTYLMLLVEEKHRKHRRISLQGKSMYPWLQRGRPNKGIVALYNSQYNCDTFLDKLLNFVYT